MSNLDPPTIPADYPVTPCHPDQPGAATCGTCGLSWDDTEITGMTPTPGGRCPFELYHPATTTPPRSRLLGR